MEIVLASGSPRRRELLSRITDKFEIIPSLADEHTDATLTPEQTVVALAEKKCNEVFGKNPDKTVIGCDTVVVYNGEILGKPRDKADAVATLKRLSGNTHLVLTGVCIRNKKRTVKDFEKTEVDFNVLDDEFINNYVDGGSPLDKAGSYGIQDGGLVRRYRGSYDNVVGLPVTLVEKMLKEVL